MSTNLLFLKSVCIVVEYGSKSQQIEQINEGNRNSNFGNEAKVDVEVRLKNISNILIKVSYLLFKNCYVEYFVNGKANETTTIKKKKQF